jgi:putative phosphoesterase
MLMSFSKSSTKLVGIISDTHDNLPLIKKVVNKLNQLNVDIVFHAGDYISPFTVAYFKPLKPKMIGVYGNNCAERTQLKKRFTNIGIDIRGYFAEVIIDDLRIALLHGHDIELRSSIINANVYNVVIHGHTHETKIQRSRRTLVINPGEVCGYLSGKSTMVLLDVKSLEVEIIDV